MSQQCVDEICASAHARHQERSRTGGIGHIWIGSLVEQHRNDAHATSDRPADQRGHPEIGLYIGVGTAVQESNDDIGEPADYGVHDCRQAARVDLVRIGAVLDKQSRDLAVPGCDRLSQRGITILVLDGGISTPFEQQPHGLRMALERCKRQRRPTVVRRRLRLGPTCQERLHYFCVPLHGRSHQRRESVFPTRVHARSLPQQHDDGFHLTARRRRDKRHGIFLRPSLYRSKGRRNREHGCRYRHETFRSGHSRTLLRGSVQG